MRHRSVLAAAALLVTAAVATGCTAAAPAPPASPPAPAPPVLPEVDASSVPGLRETVLEREGTRPARLDLQILDRVSPLVDAVDVAVRDLVDADDAAHGLPRSTAALAPVGFRTAGASPAAVDTAPLVIRTRLALAAGGTLGMRISARVDGAALPDRVVYADGATGEVVAAASLVAPDAVPGLLAALGDGATAAALDSLAFAPDGSAVVAAPTAAEPDRVLAVPAALARSALTGTGKRVQAAAASGGPLALESAAHVPCRLVACVALTYDDGPSPDTTPTLLDVLARNDVHATFFVEGRDVAARPDIVRRAAADGHAIENHTYDHPDLATLPAEDVAREVESTVEAVVAAGLPAPTLLRAPYGSTGGAVVSAVDVPLVHWSIDSFDWRDRDPAVYLPRILAGVRPGGIVLMHDIHPSTIDGQQSLIDSLRGLGYTFVTVPQLLSGRTLAPGEQVTCVGAEVSATGPACLAP